MLSDNFNRNDYYSQTEAVKLFKVSVIQLQKIVAEKGFKVLQVLIDQGDYKMVTRYVLKSDIDSLNLPKRIS